MIVSIVNNQALYGVKHPKASEVFDISMSDFQKLQSGQADLVGREVVERVIETPVPTDEELQEAKDNTLITIKIPLTILPTLTDKLSQLILLFSDLERHPVGDYLVLSNILYKYVPQFLTQEEYDQLKAGGVIFDEMIDDLFN